MVNVWKVLAIVFICLFVAETSFVIWSISLVVKEENNRDYCYWTVCDGYNNAEYNVYTQNDVCYCYDDDYNTMKTELLK